MSVQVFYVVCAIGAIFFASIVEAIVGENVRVYLGSRKAAEFKLLKDELTKR